MNLETAVGRARVGGDAVRWQGATTLRALARKEEQRRQRDAALLNRVRSGVTQEVKAGVGRKVCIHAMFAADASGQLRFLGSPRVRHHRPLQTNATHLVNSLFSLLGIEGWKPIVKIGRAHV